MKIYVSGLYCGGNPQPGVGIVRSLRQAYPEAVLVGVEYTNRVSGIHWNEIDDLWIQRPWDELNLDSYGEKVKAALDEGGFWISGSDLEAMWLASLFPEGHPNLLAPPLGALRRIAKGFQFVTVSSDARLMATGAQQAVAKMRAAKVPGAPDMY